MKKKIIIIILIFISVFGLWFLTKEILTYKAEASERELLKTQNQAIENILNLRRLKNSEENIIDPFGEDNIVRILFIGLDSRIGQDTGHCDAIQLITINSDTNTIQITAVPRGTYSPLPPGTIATSSEYYVSNACGIGGLDYGIEQIEKILGMKADYLVVVGFSETLGILRTLRLPTTETLQWLRNRHGYAIGEPQRAHNHSAFIKQMMTRFIPTKKTKLQTTAEYLVYRLIKTDLSFAQCQKIIDEIRAMNIASQPEKIQLSMKPSYLVQDIPYDSEHIDDQLKQTIGLIKNQLSKKDYEGISDEKTQATLLETIKKNMGDSKFITWAYENNLWLQIEDENKRLSTQYNLLISYLRLVEEKKERETIIADYLLEMENRGESYQQSLAKKLLADEIDDRQNLNLKEF